MSHRMLKLVAFLHVIKLISTQNGDELFSKFNQHDYKLKYERTEIVEFDKTVFKNLTAVTYKYNRTQAVTNFTFELKVDVGYDILVLVEMRKFLSNEYRSFPIRFQEKLCTFLEYDIIGLKEILSGLSCPLKKNILRKINLFYPDAAKMPPYLPSGQFRADVTYIYLDKEIVLFRTYVSIYRPFLPAGN